MSADLKVMSYDMVYVPSDREGFRNVHIDGFIENDKLKIVIVSEQDILGADIEMLVDRLRRDQLSKIKIDLDSDCTVFLSVNGKISPVKISGVTG